MPMQHKSYLTAAALSKLLEANMHRVILIVFEDDTLMHIIVGNNKKNRGYKFIVFFREDLVLIHISLRMRKL